MGIKDNFSQAVKELWKKDSEKQDAPSRPSQPTELDKYLRQDQEKTEAAVEQPVIAETPASDVVIPPSFTQSNISANTAQSTDNGTRDQQVGGFASALNNTLNSQINNRSVGQGEGNIPDTSNVNRNVQNIQGNQGQNNNANSAQDNAGYNSQGFAGRPSSPNYGQGGGNGFVPPAQNITPIQDSTETEEITVISKNTSIDGNVRSLANMQIDGNIKGNVETTKNVELSGKIIGDITGNNAGMTSAAMQGNVSLKGRIRMDRDTILMGNLSSQYADINGRIRGKLDVAGKAELKRDAIVFGDINASTIAVTDGAVIQGYVNTTFLSKDDSRNVFPEAISIDSKE